MSVRVDLRLLLPALGLLAGCASIGSPDGGARDTTPPKLVATIPPTGSTNVTQQAVRFIFSEQVQLKDLQKNLLVTPTLPDDNTYKLREERSAIELRFEKPFAPNTTYVFNLRDAVADITESNLARGVLVAFSTGATLDSGAVVGTVQDLLTGAPAPEALIALYPAQDTTDIFRNRPYYEGRTDKQGRFQLRYLREGQYRLYALLDKNQNSQYNEPELVAYLPAPITVGASRDSVRLRLVRPDSRRPLRLSNQATPTQVRVGYNEGLRQFALTPLGQALTPAQATRLRESAFLTERGRTLALQSSPALLAGRYIISATDSAGNVGTDTLDVKFEASKTARRGPAYTLVGNPRNVYRNGQLRLQFNEPVRLVPNKPFATLVEDSTTRRALRTPADGVLSPDRTLLTVNLNTRAKTNITLIPDSTAILAVSGQSLGFKPQRLAVSDQAETGSLSGTVQTKYRSYELQLLDEKFALISSQLNPRTFRFDNLRPGTYRLRVLVDANNDGRWQGGDPQLRQPAEPVYLFPQPQQVRANWDIENLKLEF